MKALPRWLTSAASAGISLGSKVTWVWSRPREAKLPTVLIRIERSAAVMVADVTSTAAIQRVDAESLLSGASAQSNTYETMLRQDGVDSDREMESLLALERAYAANAKVLQTVDDMIQTILRLT